VNEAIMQSIKWHKDRLFKLLDSDQELEKYEGSIYNLEKDFDEMIEKLERGLRKEKVPVHRKSGITYEYRRVGRKEEEKTSGEGKKITSVRPINSALKKAGLPLSKKGSVGAIKGRSLSIAGAGVDIDFDNLSNEWNISMRYGFHDLPTPEQKKQDMDKIKSALEKGGIEYRVAPEGTYLIVKKSKK